MKLKFEQRSELDDVSTLVAIGVLAATAATLAHETVGHGGACLLTGGEVTVLTSMVVHCRPGSAWADLAGPAGNLVVGAGALIAAGRLRGAAGLFALLLAAFSLFWFAGMTLYTAVAGGEDLAFAARTWSWPGAWRAAAAAAGVVVYWSVSAAAARRLHALGGTSRRRVGIAWAAAVASAVAAGLLWARDPGLGAWRGFATFALFPLPLAWSAARGIRVAGAAAPIGRSWAWIAAGAVVFATFALVQGRGVGPLA